MYLETPERYGITYLEQEESYTSQASAWIWMIFPHTSRIHPIQELSAGNEPARPVPFANGRTANADINGAGLRKGRTSISRTL